MKLSDDASSIKLIQVACNYNFLDNIKANPGLPGIDFYMNNNIKPMRRKF